MNINLVTGLDKQEPEITRRQLIRHFVKNTRTGSNEYVATFIYFERVVGIAILVIVGRAQSLSEGLYLSAQQKKCV